MDENNDNQILKEQWPEMTVNQLLEQRNILFDKWIFLVENKIKWADQIKAGIDEIDNFINEKFN